MSKPKTTTMIGQKDHIKYLRVENKKLQKQNDELAKLCYTIASMDKKYDAVFKRMNVEKAKMILLSLKRIAK